MDLAVTVAIVLGSVGILLFILYRLLTRNYGYWEAQGVPTVKPRLIFGSSLEIFRRPPHEVEDDRYQKYGRMYGTYEFSTRALNIADPQLAHQVLVKDFHIFTNHREFKSKITIIDNFLSAARDETWKRIRTVVSPSFTSGKMRKMNPHFVEAAHVLVENFSAAAGSEETVDLKTYFSYYSMDVLGLCAFGIRVDSQKNPDHPFVINSRKLFARDIQMLTFLIFMIPGMSRMLGNYLLRKLGIAYFVEVSEEIIRKRKELQETGGRVDLVQLMLDAREGKLDKDEEDVQQTGHFAEQQESGNPRSFWNIPKTLSDLEILAQATLFLAAGHETTSTAMAFMAYELALNPDIQERAYQEVRETYEAHGEFNYDVVSKMPYLEAVISETLRLHTIALKVEREASQEYILQSTGVRIPKGGIINVLAHAIHHDPEWYPEPYRFDPDRFLPENRSSLTPYTFLPFGDGPRNCMAMRFALLEIKLCMAMSLRKVKFVATEETKIPPQFYITAGLLIPKEIKVKVGKRV